MKQIFNSPSFTIYKTHIEDFNQERLITELRYNIDVNENTKYPKKTNPGIQSGIVLTGGEISKINNIVCNYINKFIYKSENLYSFNNWVYLSSRENKYSGFHSHTKMDILKTEGEWTWTFYVQMPDNLKDNDGRIIFESNVDTFSILPNEGDLLVFPASTKHMPITNTSSDRERIVLAGTLSKIDLNKSYIKQEKTLF